MSTSYDFLESEYELERMVKFGNQIFEKNLYSELDKEELDQVSEQHFKYGTVHFSFDVEGEEVRTAVYGEVEAAREVEEILEETVERINEDILTSEAIDY